MKKSIIGIVIGVVVLIGILGFILYSESQTSLSNSIEEPAKELIVPTGRNLSVNLSENLDMRTGP